MLEEVFQEVYTKFKLHFYQSVFQRFATREATLTTVESFCMEGIMAMGEPTIAEFSRMMQISTPNAAYKIGSLVKKGYTERERSEKDRRIVYIHLTGKGRQAFHHHAKFHEQMTDAVMAELGEEEVQVLGKTLKALTDFFRSYKK